MTPKMAKKKCIIIQRRKLKNATFQKWPRKSSRRSIIFEFGGNLDPWSVRALFGPIYSFLVVMNIFCHIRDSKGALLTSVFFFPRKLKVPEKAFFRYFFWSFLGGNLFFSPTFAQIFSGTRTFSLAQNDFFSRVEVRISRA